LIVALLGAALLGEALTTAKALAVVAIGLGVVLMASETRGGGAAAAAAGGASRKALAWALGTAAFTAAYTLVDGVGARLSGTASGFTLWMFVGDGLAMLLCALLARGGGQALFRLLPAWRSGLAAGALSLGSYWIAIWAFTRAPIALVAALRETSVLFAMLLAVFVLGERAGARRWGAAALVATGVALMRA
jgi:drug/metabolite transporter (DMT)-like permease